VCALGMPASRHAKLLAVTLLSSLQRIAAEVRRKGGRIAWEGLVACAARWSFANSGVLQVPQLNELGEQHHRRSCEDDACMPPPSFGCALVKGSSVSVDGAVRSEILANPTVEDRGMRKRAYSGADECQDLATGPLPEV